MQYPDRLLPRPEYSYISVDDSTLDNYFLQRSTPDTDIINPESGKIKASYISLQSGHLHDLSTNLIGNFLPDDRFFQITGVSKSFYTAELWNEDDREIQAPVFGTDFDYDNTKGAIYFKIARLKNFSIPYNIGEKDGFIALCKIIHTPVRANFWHFSLRWFNEEGDVLNQKGTWKNRMLTSARSALIEFGILVLQDEIAPIPESSYLK